MNQLVAKLRTSPRRVFGAVMCAVGVVLLIASVAGEMSGAPPDTSRPRAAVAGGPDIPPANDAAEPSQSDEQPAQQQTPKPASETQTNTPQTQDAATQPTTAENPPKPEAATTIQVSLTINNSYKGKISLPKDSDQCDVLRQARTDGLIDYLSLKYNETLKTYGVHVIDDTGDENNVWWAYTVNGKSPPLGCSLIPAKGGDIIKWTYVK